MKRGIYLLLVLALLLASAALAAEKKDELRYEVNVTIRFNSLNVVELAEVQKVLDRLAAKSCKTEINMEKLPKDSATFGTVGSGIVYTIPAWMTTPGSTIGVESGEDNE